MELIVVGSGSSGNTYLLVNEAECLVLDAGLPFMEVKKALKFNIRKIVGVIATHEHGDHAKYLNDYKKNGIKVFTPYNDEHAGMIKCFGNFTVNAFPLTDKKGKFVHTNSDGSECVCYGFLVNHPDMHNLVYVTDCSFVRWNFSKHNLHHILVECNYSADILNLDDENKSHVIQGHMSLDTTKEFIKANKTNFLETVTLCHLSRKNSDKAMFQKEIENIVDCAVNIAEKGKVINLNTLPF